MSQNGCRNLLGLLFVVSDLQFCLFWVNDLGRKKSHTKPVVG